MRPSTPPGTPRPVGREVDELFERLGSHEARGEAFVGIRLPLSVIKTTSAYRINRLKSAPSDDGILLD